MKRTGSPQTHFVMAALSKVWWTQAEPKAQLPLVCTTPRQDAGNRQRQDLPIQREGPVVDVLHVLAHPGLEVQLIAALKHQRRRRAFWKTPLAFWRKAGLYSTQGRILHKS